ncbi:hypothetical protein NW762_003816 [Fusarium torreyae]|uniref:Heterokaryon incompatibility domain-containing protein n=1 Tax=Fusarium torreyae TaxID=1237075 RepID=A0A9W8S8H1_9HYPO|nr:hypothetical protein NW762_003816 [Fusarium torreyae]
MSSNLCSSCIGIFQGRYVPTSLLFEKDLLDIEDADFRIIDFETDKTEWKVRLDDATETGLPLVPYLHHTLHGLAESANSCALCAMIWEALRQEKQPAARPERLEEMKEKKTSLIGIPIIRPKAGMLCGMFTLAFLYAVFEGHKLYGRSFRTFHMFKTINISQPDNRMIWRPEFDREQSLSRIRTWLDSSTTISRLAPRLPTRLLHCRPSTDPKDKPTVRLVNTQNLDTSTRYVALSHRWGAVRPLMLLQDLEDEFYDNIAFDSIPATFQDAIRLSDALGIEYIWIDSLCIIQDSKDDWHTEAAHMASVYSQAYVTISATAAQDSAAGLREQHPMLKHPCEIMPSWSGFSREEMPPGAVRIINKGAFCDEVLSQPLFRRGWVFQEWILSPKTIHVARDQLWWTSASSMKSESFASNETCEGYEFEANREFQHTMAPGTLYSIKGQSDQTQRQVWHTLLQDFMSRALTFESDRLVAFAGIAALYQSYADIPTNSYLAGIWRQALLQDLLWAITDGRKVIPPQQYRAPSWSWASVEPAQAGKFLIGNRDLNEDLDELEEPWVPTATVLDVSVTAAGSEFGSASDGYVVLQGPLIEARLFMSMVDLTGRLTAEQAAEFVPGGRLRYVHNYITLPNMEKPVGGLLLTEAHLDDVFPTLLPEEVITIHLAVLYCRKSMAGESLGHALALVKGLGKGEFRRIGYVTMTEDTMIPWKGDRNFGAFDPLKDEDYYLSAGDKPGSYNYRIV